MEAVVDSSAVIDALLGLERIPATLQAGTGVSGIHLPCLVDAEVLNCLRRLVRLRQATTREAEAVLHALTESPARRYPHGPLLTRAWQLRHNVSAYDALYVSLAEKLGLPLITTDLRLARAASKYCDVRALPFRRRE